MTEKIIKKVCDCVNCGNEAEMAVTCRLEEIEAAPGSQGASKKVKGHSVCSHCGNEADMWIDVDEVTGG